MNHLHVILTTALKLLSPSTAQESVAIITLQK